MQYKLSDAEQTCPKCVNTLHIMSKEVCKELKIIPAKVSVVEHVSYIYDCHSCEKSDIETPVITAQVPKALIGNQYCKHQ